MNREKGVAYCGLACCVCSENANCAGCRNDGCGERNWCEIQRCCRAKGLAGCWECAEFPCDAGMFHKPRLRVFVRLLREHGESKMTDWLERNERAGVVYHDPGKLTGDYDRCKTEAEIKRLVTTGKPK